MHFKQNTQVTRLIRKLQSIILKASLLKIYKSFFIPHLDYGDAIYYCESNESFQDKSESECRVTHHRSYNRFFKREALPATSSRIAKIMSIVPKIVLVFQT